MKKKYDSTLIEKNKNKKWIDKKYFTSHDSSKESFSIILPPPNVTGKLHLGHAWDTFIQDTMIRYKKLTGFDVMWVTGMDHAGIATQARVEKRLFFEEKITKHDLGREKFLDKVWAWKDEYASEIKKQWSKLGLALDYENVNFTLDENTSKAVSQVFKDMYKDGLIYRGERAIHWDPQLETVVSNIEVDNSSTNSTMYYFAYPLQDGGKIEIATTRPETMFSDVAIAINPKNEKLKKHIGKIAISPLTKKELPIIGDRSIELDKGTGAMKVSAHAILDFDIIKKNKLEVIECIDTTGKMNRNAQELVGLDRFDARTKVVEKLKSSLIKEEEISNNVSISQRSGAIVEILVQPQWFVKMDHLAKLVLDNLKAKDGVKFFPSKFADILKHWMENIEDWCISRQLWWGHQIPVWSKGEEIKVQEESPGSDWKQDEDVLDTWFSSALAPFAFLKWPEQEGFLKKYYPSDLLVTGYDIIFFWVARMYFQSLYFMKEIPFKDVLIHGLIRTEDGQKMSKSLNNGIDPMDVIDQYGADSLRWFLMTNSSPGQDVRFSEEKLRAAWNLNNKLWNISRFIIDVMPDEQVDNSSVDEWIINKFARLQTLLISKIESYEFTIISKELTNFIMNEFSSWYIEMSKAKPNKRVAKYILENLLILLHPFLPFISDHIYEKLTGKEILEQEIIVVDSQNVSGDVDLIIEIVKSVRNFREVNQIPLSKELQYYFSQKLSEFQIKTINKLTNASYKENKDTIVAIGQEKLYIVLSDELKELNQKRITAQISFLEKEIARSQGILNNKQFIAKAPTQKVNLEKQKLEKYISELDVLKNKS